MPLKTPLGNIRAMIYTEGFKGGRPHYVSVSVPLGRGLIGENSSLALEDKSATFDLRIILE